MQRDKKICIKILAIVIYKVHNFMLNENNKRLFISTITINKTNNDIQQRIKISIVKNIFDFFM